MNKNCCAAAILVMLSALPAFPAKGAARADRLDEVLTNMDKAAAGVSGMEAQITYTKVTVVVNDVEKKTGGIWFERGGKNYKVKIDFRPPATEEGLIYSDKGTAWSSHPKITKTEKYDIGK